MRRTYRSKKETGGALSHRDILQNMDEKSSAFDAFYIQHIKQTKREVSCVGSSNTFGVASNKVRKKKYVKRIAKGVENPPQRDSVSTSAYLTPDKSLRVNKVLDPFDMLLNSSSTGQVPKDVEYKNDVDQPLPRKARKTYTKKKVKKVKKINYSSSESDKENVSTCESNMTDIRTHELLVERENSNSSKYVDDTLYKIVNNLSLINNFKEKVANASIDTSYKHRNELMKNNWLSIQTSPLCSTPFKEKYRGKSIYNFSPISTNVLESPNYVTITEENNDSFESIVLSCKGKYSKLCKKQQMPLTHVHIPAEENLPTEWNNSESIIYENDIDPELAEKEQHHMHTSSSNLENTPVELSSSQVIEAQPFLGFSSKKVSDSVTNYIDCLIKCTQEKDSEDIKANEYSNDINFADDSVSGRQNNEHSEFFIENENVTLYQIDNNKTDKVLKKVETNCPEIIYDQDVLEFHKNALTSKQIEADIANTQQLDVDNNVSYDSIIGNIDSNEMSGCDSSNYTQDSENESIYDTCNESHSEEENINEEEPRVVIQRLNNSIFMKYYRKMLKENPLTDESHSEIDDVPNKHIDKLVEIENQVNISTDEDTKTSYCNTYEDDISKAVPNSIETEPNEIIITDSSTTEDLESNDDEPESEEMFVSFVTTRKRNEITNDSMFIFNYSYGSSNTDCDNTVLSNKKESIEKRDLDLDNVVNENKLDTNELRLDISGYFTGSEISRITTRKSSRNMECDVNAEINKNEDTIIAPQDNYNDCEVTIQGTSKQALKLDNSLENIRSSDSHNDSIYSDIYKMDAEVKPSIVLQPGKKWERSLSIYRRMTTMADNFNSSILDNETQKKGRKYRQSVISTMEMQDSLYNESINSRRSTFISKPSRPTIRFVKDTSSRISLNATTEDYEDLEGFLNEECDDTVIELSKQSLADSDFEVTVLDNFHETSGRLATARDYVLRRCNQSDPILFDECYPDTVLKNCHKIGEGVYGEVFLWRGYDGRARVMKIVPIAGSVKVNGEDQKDFHEIISEIVIAMELSALRAPIADIDRYFDEGKDIEALDLHSVENATDVFNEVLAVRCVQGPYPTRLLDLWELFDECKGSENDNPASLPADQQYIVLELANAGQDLESYQFTGAQQAHALFQQIAFGLAVGEEAFQFEHRDLHWGNVLIAPTEQKLATFVLRGRTYRVPRGGVAATIIDYSLSRVTVACGGARAALYNDLARDHQLFEAVGDYQFQVYRLMRDKCSNEWKNFEPYTNILWLHYTVDKMITALRYKRTNTKIHKHYIEKLKGIRDQLLDYKSATEYVLTDIEI